MKLQNSSKRNQQNKYRNRNTTNRNFTLRTLSENSLRSPIYSKHFAVLPHVSLFGLRNSLNRKFLRLMIFGFCFITAFCSSRENKNPTFLEDTSYEIKFSPCVCKRQDMIVQAKKVILAQGIKDYTEFTAKEIEPELESEIIEKEYDHFLYDFSLQNKPNSQSNINEEDYITAEGKVNQKELNNYIEINSKPNRRKPMNSSTDYGSKGLEVIKGFQSDRKKRHTVSEISKSRPITLYEMKRK